jgi:hypothetical protein
LHISFDNNFGCLNANIGYQKCLKNFFMMIILDA